MPGLSRNPDARDRQLANLRRGPGRPMQPANEAALKHGLRSRGPALVLDPIVQEVEEAIAEGLPLQAQEPGGGVPAADAFTVGLAAVAILQVRRCWQYLSDHGDIDPATGAERPEVEALGKRLERAARLLDRLGCSPLARAKLGLDLARTREAAGCAIDREDDDYLFSVEGAAESHAALRAAAFPDDDAEEPA